MTLHPSSTSSGSDGPVLVTGAGGPAGVAVIRALMGAGETVIGVDADADAVGLRLAHYSALVTEAGDPGYIDSLLVALSAAGARNTGGCIVPTVAEELLPLWLSAERLASSGVGSWVPDPSAVTACVDKWRLFEAFRTAGVPSPESSLGDADQVPGPWVVKPRFGRGSRDVIRVEDRDALAAAVRMVPEPLVQRRLTGREFTVDTLTERSGEIAGLAPRWRTQTRGGISTLGTTFADPAVAELVTAALGAVGLVGPANVQGFQSEDGVVAVTEINPRFSGGLPLSLAAGADLVGEYVRAVRGRPIRRERLVATPGVTMRRYFEELFEWPPTEVEDS